MAGTGDDFSFLDEPVFEKSDGRVTCVVRVRCGGTDWAVTLELDDGAWRVVSDAAVLESCPSVLDAVKNEYAKGGLVQ